MEKKLFFLLEIFLFLFFSPFVFAQEDFLEIPRIVKGKGTYFEIKDSEYLNIILDSEKEISLILESMPKMVSLSINSSTDATSTNLVISGLENNKTYYKYEDSYRNGIEISVGENGQYSWQQDLTKPHHLWFQEKRGTIFIPFNPENPTDPKSCVPPYGIWDEKTRTCVLTQNLTESVEITTSSITFDCNLFSIIGDGTGYGIYLNSKTNVEIKNCTTTNFSKGIFLNDFSENNFIHNNFIFKNEWLGIDLLGASNNIVKENIILKNFYGIRVHSVWFPNAFYNLISENKINNNKDLGLELHESNFNKIEKNEFSSNGSDDGTYNVGLLLDSSSYNEVIENAFLNNKWAGIFIEGWWEHPSTKNKLVKNNISNNKHGILLAYYVPENYFRENVLTANEFNFGIRFDARFAPYIYFQNIDTSNTVDGKPIYYLINQQGQVLDSSSNAGFVGVINSENIIVKDLVIKNSFDGILFYNSKNSKIENVKLENNLHGIGIYSSSGIEIERSEIINNGVGISLIDSSNSQIKRNIISGNGGGSMVWWYVNGGIVQTGSANNIFFENEISKNKGVGIYLGDSNNNKVFHNNFIDNQGLDQYFSICRGKQSCVYQGDNIFFDNGYPSGGNYWSDYQGEDKFSGPNQDQPGSDGIGDTPYCLTTGCDRYPFMQANSWSLPKVLISEVYYYVNRGKDPDNEWIILHNPHNEPIDISGWKIEDNYATDTIPQSPIIPPRSFAIISASSTTFDYWKIPKNMVKIVLENKRIGNGLRNDGDRVILKDKDGNIVDAMSYGDDSLVFNPSCPPVKKGKSLLRSPLNQDTDTAFDFIESEPTISKNKLPIPIIKFSPKNPVKGIEVKFDASYSTDIDGEIINFEWQIKDTSISEILATSIATTTTFSFPENGEYEVTLTAIDNDGATSSTSTIIKVEPFSFAIITDLHIGRHYREEYHGEDYYLTERLKNVVKWINQNKGKVKCENEICPLRFLVILGDITENTPISGFCKTKEILDNLEIPYVLVFGNHDVGTDEEYEQCSRWKGQDYFDQVFWSTSPIPCSNATSTKNFETLLKEFNFQRDEQNKNYKNFSFSFGGLNFVGLDFVSREKFMKVGPGVGSDAVLNEINKNWLKEKLEEFKENPTILLAHHPMKIDFINAFTEDEIKQIIEILNKSEVPIELGGHIHSFEEFHGHGEEIANANKRYSSINRSQIFTTEALMVGSNGRGVGKITKDNGVVDSKKGIVRIVKVFEKNVNNPNNWETTETGDEFLAFNPYFNFGFSLQQHLGKPCIELEGNGFCDKNVKPYTILWDFGDGEIKKEIQEYTKCYDDEGKYKITLTLKDKNSDFSESISKEVEIKEGIIVKTIKRTQEQIENGIRFFSEKSQMFFDKIGEIGGKIKTWILKEKSEPKPIGVIDIDFDKLEVNLELETLVADTDFNKRKSILYMPQWPDEIERSKILFVPIK